MSRVCRDTCPSWDLSERGWLVPTGWLGPWGVAVTRFPRAVPVGGIPSSPGCFFEPGQRAWGPAAGILPGDIGSLCTWRGKSLLCFGPLHCVIVTTTESRVGSWGPKVVFHCTRDCPGGPSVWPCLRAIRCLPGGPLQERTVKGKW